MNYRNNMSRRDFVKVTGLALGAGAVAGMESFAGEAPTAVKGTTAVGIARGETMGSAVRKAVELSGGMDFIKSGQTVLIKPNVNSGEAYPASTNPEVLYEVVKMVWERDPKRVIVGDRSNYRRNTREEMRRAGIDKAILDAKATGHGQHHGIDAADKCVHSGDVAALGHHHLVGDGGEFGGPVGASRGDTDLVALLAEMTSSGHARVGCAYNRDLHGMRSLSWSKKEV